MLRIKLLWRPGRYRLLSILARDHHPGQRRERPEGKSTAHGILVVVFGPLPFDVAGSHMSEILHLYCAGRAGMPLEKVFDRKAEITATYTGNCNWNESYVPTVRAQPDSPTYCFLSEILFQVSTRCSNTPGTPSANGTERGRIGRILARGATFIG